ncbi:MAG: 23S rRNA (uracil(1939)-C(5))-methyltransferase RlmD [Pasteurellaceae bacterium]|nr:23S rRNA (uracil(1939)-C(5))-methyltransferase RlmD [Pasteurellaceae bacterium]
MALFYNPKKSAASNVQTRQTEIIDLDYQGLGVAKINGKTWFIENSLPSESVQFVVREEKRQYGLGRCNKILRASEQRVQPRCADYTLCGGCQSQHISINLQRQAKQQALFHRLQRLQSQPIKLMPMLIGEPWAYRRRVKFSLKFNPRTKQLDMGFRQKNSNEIVNIQQCDVLEPRLSQCISPLRALLKQIKQPKLLGHIELVLAQNGVAMLLRHSKNMENFDRGLWLDFAKQHQLHLFLQDDQRIQKIAGEMPYYQLNDLNLQFDIRDFIQVNAELNQKMVATALDWLAIQADETVLDLFCGMGNFSLPLAQVAKQVIGVEGVLEMVHKAEKNAQQNGLENVQFYQADLTQPFTQQAWAKTHFDKILLDPPRAGADFALQAVCQLQAKQILYISCNPATLVRDAEIILRSGYVAVQVAMIDMFPQTGHLESMTLFEKQ